MIKYYVKKLVSLSPDKYKFVDPNKAYKSYCDWIKHIITMPSYDFKESYKSFEKWLATEI